MLIKTIQVGSLQTNCYIVIDEKSREAVVIDPGDEAAKILAALKNLKTRYIILTHGHLDHLGAVEELKGRTGAMVLMNTKDKWFLTPDKEIKEGDKIEVGDFKFAVIHTPGHTEGSICLYTPGHLFSGDTLFSTAHGRVDLPGGSMQEMAKSLKRLATLPNDTIVYPGHDEETSIKQEKERGTLA